MWLVDGRFVSLEFDQPTEHMLDERLEKLLVKLASWCAREVFAVAFSVTQNPRIRRVAWLLGLVLVAFASAAPATEFKVGGVAIDVPSRFEGPASAQSEAQAKVYVFTVRAASSLTPSSVLQVTEYGAATDPQVERPAAVSQRYLLQMLEGIERRRTEYRASAPQEIRVAGLPGSVVAWQGKANGIGTNGKMYCIVTESALVFFHVMGGGSVPNADMAAAIKAVESAHKYWICSDAG
jgi:hypothetical protein